MLQLKIGMSELFDFTLSLGDHLVPGSRVQPVIFPGPELRPIRCAQVCRLLGPRREAGGSGTSPQEADKPTPGEESGAEETRLPPGAASERASLDRAAFS